MKKTLLSLSFMLLLAWSTAAQQAATRSPQREPTNAREAAEKKNVADKATEEEYAALVATLPSDERAWERTLQDNLGDFYLPIHMRMRVQGRSSCWDFVRDDPKLPRVLLIGDSISGGYTLPVRKALAGKANVHKAPENCGPTTNGLKKLDVWLAGAKWDVIHFNFGLHDSRAPVADYERRLREIVARLKTTGAKLIWASTTPRPADAKEGAGLAAAVIARNEVAARVMREHGIPVDDLFTCIEPQLTKLQKPKDVHFNDAGYKLLGKQVADSIEAALK